MLIRVDWKKEAAVIHLANGPEEIVGQILGKYF